VVTSLIEATPPDSIERAIMECFRTALLDACKAVEEASPVALVVDNAERGWLQGKGSAEIARELGVSEGVVCHAIDNKTEILEMMRA
jgi:hypothetical protein